MESGLVSQGGPGRDLAQAGVAPRLLHGVDGVPDVGGGGHRVGLLLHVLQSLVLLLQHNQHSPALYPPPSLPSPVVVFAWRGAPGV